jgi:hypothetical protein
VGWLYFIVPIIMLVGLGGFIEWRRKKNNNYSHIPTNPDIRPGESQNFSMGDRDKDIGSGM